MEIIENVATDIFLADNDGDDNVNTIMPIEENYSSDDEENVNQLNRPRSDRVMRVKMLRF